MLGPVVLLWRLSEVKAFLELSTLWGSVLEHIKPAIPKSLMIDGGKKIKHMTWENKREQIQVIIIISITEMSEDKSGCSFNWWLAGCDAIAL